jgi:Trk-type K+ transport system membrane component
MEAATAFLSPSNRRLQAIRRFVEHSIEENHYRIIFVSYTLVVTIVSSCLMYAIQHSVEDVPVTTFFACVFQAISSFTCTGLSIARIPTWSIASLIIVVLTMECGSIVLCSSIPSILRIRRLRKIHCRLLSDRKLVRRHLHVNIAIVWCCVMYWIVVHLLAFVLLVGKRGAWWTIFHEAAALNNGGFSLDPNSFASPELAGDSYLIAVLTIIMPMGNTLLPVWQQLFMRTWRALMWKLSDTFPSQQYTPHLCFLNLSAKEMGDAINELLERPAAYYTHLFLPKQTFVLFLMWCALTSVDYLMFIPEYNTNAFVVSHNQWLQALFQTVTVRTTGFTIMNIDEIQLGHLSYWVMAMYLSSYPFIITDVTARSLHEDDDYASEFPEAVEPPPRLQEIPLGVVAVSDPAVSVDASVAHIDLRAVLRGSTLPPDDDDNDAVHDDASDTVSSRSEAGVSNPSTRPAVDSEPKEQLNRKRVRLTKQSLEQLYDMPPSRLVRRRHEPIRHEGSQESATTSAGDGEPRLPAQTDHPLSTDGASSSAFVPRGVRSALHNIKSQAGSTVAQEIGWLYLSCIIICYIEGFGIATTPDASPLMRLLFEISSAYGTVGLSIASASAPDLSFSFILRTESQVIIWFLMYFGKFRGLPQTIELDAVQHLLQRRNSQLIQRGVRFAEMVHTIREPSSPQHEYEGVRDAPPTRFDSVLSNTSDGRTT